MTLSVFLPVICLSQNRYDVVIDEIMADPAPQVGLPNNEWIELKNVSSSPVNLQGWRIGDATSQSAGMPNFILQPDSFLIVCSPSSVMALSGFGNTVSVSGFPSLGNEGDEIFLRSGNSRTVHAVSYSSSWYQNTVKRDGGWTLEMIDTRSPCAGLTNWTASINAQGGTPGKRNSVDAVNNDQAAPRLKYAYATDSTTIIAVFDEPVDSLKGATPGNYSIDGGLSVVEIITLSPLFNSVHLKLKNPMAANTVYALTANNVADCQGNIIGTFNKVRVGLIADAAQLELVINEILFNPKSNGYDYVEFYNRSGKIFDASKLYIANRNGSNVINSIKQISANPFDIFPGDYFVITEDAASLEINYLVKNVDDLIALSSLPSYPDDEGDVVLLNGQGALIDEVKYKQDWHFKLIQDAEGVSLERVDPDGPSQDPGNWHSAASTAGFGTPTYQTSQYKQSHVVNATIQVTPRIFSPDNDGHDDVASIQYIMTEGGYIGNVTIFDVQGRPVRYLAKNAILGLHGVWNWDGVDETGNKLPVGMYIVYTEIFNMQGKKQNFKSTLVLARKLK